MKNYIFYNDSGYIFLFVLSPIDIISTVYKLYKSFRLIKQLYERSYFRNVVTSGITYMVLHGVT